METGEERVEDGFGSERSGPPWENPDAGDLFQRGWKTIVQGVTEPYELFDQMRITGGLFQPLLFYVIIIGLALIISMVLEMPFRLIGGGLGDEQLFGMGFGVFFFLGFLAVLPILLPIGLLISSGLTHLGLMIFGAARQPFEATFRVNAYAYGSVGWTWAIPFCGSMIGGIWGIVLEIVGIARVHEVSTGKAVAAVLVPIAVLFGLGFCLFAAFGLAVIGLVASGT